MYQNHPDFAQQMVQSHIAELVDGSSRERQVRDTAAPGRPLEPRRLSLVMAALAPIAVLPAILWVPAVR
jgi:hypothetical protein